MNIAITGASGFVGRRLTGFLQRQGHSITPISLHGDLNPSQFAGCNAVVHLAGEPIAQRWSPAVKQRILESREQGTRKLIAALAECRPNVLASASAVGYYGSCGDTILTEQSPPGEDFLAKVTLAWEREAREVGKLGTRLVILRFGAVLGPGGGALSKMLLPFKLGLGGRVAGGDQWMSWIHIEDLCGMIALAIGESTLRGVWNAVSPNPVTNAKFTEALARAVHRPAVIPVPAFALRLLYGEMAQVILGSQRAIPEAAVRAGYEFRYPDIVSALIKIVEG
jgi:hypothetical protein